MEEISGPMVSSVSRVSDTLRPTAERMNETGIALRNHANTCEEPWRASGRLV
jgi:hypothetical protein